MLSEREDGMSTLAAHLIIEARYKRYLNKIRKAEFRQGNIKELKESERMICTCCVQMGKM